MSADVDVLERWVESGDAPEAAADVLARAATTDPRERERLRAQLVPTLAATHPRRKRESLLKKRMQPGV